MLYVLTTMIMRTCAHYDVTHCALYPAYCMLCYYTTISNLLCDPKTVTMVINNSLFREVMLSKSLLVLDEKGANSLVLQSFLASNLDAEKGANSLVLRLFLEA